MKKWYSMLLLAVLFFSYNDGTSQCIGGNSAVTVISVSEGSSVTFTDPRPPNGQITQFAGLINCSMDGNPFKSYCIDLFHTVSLPDAGYSETCEYAVPRAQYILNNYFPLRTGYPGILSDNEEAASVQMALWAIYDGVPLSTITNQTIRDRALAIKSDADLNGITTPSIPTFSFETGMDPDGFFIKTIDENGNPISVQNIVISISEGNVSEDTVSTGVTGFSPQIIVSGASNGTIIIAEGTTLYAPGRIVDGILPGKQTLSIAFPVLGTMKISISWGALPVELSSFTSVVNGRNVDLNWVTSAETNNSGFEVERIVTGVNTWTKIGFVNGNGTSATPHNYTYSDRGLQTANYSYRLKQIDYNGNFEYHYLSNEVIIGVPDKFILSQNYPNPFNPSTKIHYAIPFDGKVSLTIYDNSGKEVAKLVNNNLTAGNYTANFDASSFASGVYYYRLNLNGPINFSETKRMMLVK